MTREEYERQVSEKLATLSANQQNTSDKVNQIGIWIEKIFGLLDRTVTKEDCLNSRAQCRIDKKKNGTPSKIYWVALGLMTTLVSALIVILWRQQETVADLLKKIAHP